MLYAKLGTALALLVAEPCAALFGACKLGDAQIVEAGGSRRLLPVCVKKLVVWKTSLPFSFWRVRGTCQPEKRKCQQLRDYVQNA